MIPPSTFSTRTKRKLHTKTFCLPRLRPSALTCSFIIRVPPQEERHLTKKADGPVEHSECLRAQP